LEFETLSDNLKYTYKEFSVDIINILYKVGLENKKVIFLFSEKQMNINDIFLDDINNLIQTGEIPGLLQKENYDYIY
jgi:dynein heavy chain